MPAMRVTIRQTRALLVGALAVACASRPTAPPFTPMPSPLPPGSPKELPIVAAHAGAVFTFRGTPNLADAPIEVQRLNVEMPKMFGIDVAGVGELARAGADPNRPVVISWGIVDPEQLFAVISAPQPPTRETAFAIRAQIVVPVADMARAPDLLPKASTNPACALRQGEPDRWAAAIANLRDAADRRVAEREGFAYFCRGDSSALVAQFDAGRRQVTWVAAAGSGALLAAAAASVEFDGMLAPRLKQDGFFAARTAVYTAPADEARMYTATDLVKIQEAIVGADET
jgi:hypothetical protein